MRRIAVLTLPVLLAASVISFTPSSLEAQHLGPQPPRPKNAVADTNDARAYFDYGVEVFETEPNAAASAFYWAARIDPGMADALYARRAAVLMSDPGLRAVRGSERGPGRHDARLHDGHRLRSHHDVRGRACRGDLHDALDRLEKLGLKRLVLDLRDNGGGSLKEAADVAGEFLPKGTVVYTSAGRKREVADTGRVSRSFWRSERRYPIVVMANGGTASASELVAGALQDHDRALIVGRPTFGKSLMMRGFPLADGSVIVLVIGHVKTPCGRVVQRQYRDITTREYYRLARADRDTAGRPACTTSAGRRVFGGGGIYPDVLLESQTGAPAWWERVREQDLTLAWVGGYVSANAASLTSLDAFLRAPSVPAAAVADFRAFAGRQGVTIPTDGDADGLLQRVLTRAVAAAKWGDVGEYGVSAKLDTEVTAALRSFDRAATLLGAPGR